MTNPRDPLERLEHHVGQLFTAGVTISAVTLAAGLAMFLIAPEKPATNTLLNAGLLVLMVAFNLVNIVGLDYNAQLIVKGIIIIAASALYAQLKVQR